MNNRTTNSVKNSITSVIANITNIISTFITQTLFIKILGIEYLGINGLFSNILTMLSLFDLGLGSAIVFHMYKPIAEDDTEKVKSLIGFYRKAYNIIAIVVLVVGCLLMPFLENIVGKVSIDVNIKLVFFLLLLGTISSYIMVYKRNMLYAYQKNYIINLVHCLYIILLNVGQIAILLFTKNYYLYLCVKIVCQLLENVILNIICNKKYPYIKGKKEKLDEITSKSIFSDVKALIFHKIGTIIIFGTDNIIISKFLGVAIVGFYNNYQLIIAAVNTLFGQIISSVTASVGNLMTQNNPQKSFDVFKKVRFINFWISCFTAISILTIIQPFIKMWLGNNFLLSALVLIILVINYFQKMQRNTYSTFKDSAGIWKPDRFVPLIESIINIIASVILVKLIGLAGVFIGTILSGLTLWCYSYPKFVYKNLFKRSYFQYAKETIEYILVFIIIATITYCSSLLIVVDNNLSQIIINAILCIIIPNFLIYAIYRKNEEFDYVINLIKKVKKRIIK